MFKNIKNFAYKRNWKEAMGFYLTYLFFGLILGAVLGAIVVLVGAVNINNYDQLGRFAVYFSGTYCAIISGLLLTKKKLWGNLGYVFLAFLGIFLAVGSGTLLGLIIPAFITTKNSPA